MGLDNIIFYMQQDPMMGLFFILISFTCVCVAISFHEWAHAFVAYKLGDPTAKNMGRMTISPFAHMDAVGLLMFVIFGFGWAKPVVVSSRNLKKFRRDDVLISLAGPLMNLLIAFVATGVYVYTFSMFADNPFIEMFLQFLISMNLNFAIFNVLPIYPLDGFHVLTSMFRKENFKVVEFMQNYGTFILILLMITGVLDGVIGWLSSSLFNLFANLFFMVF